MFLEFEARFVGSKSERGKPMKRSKPRYFEPSKKQANLNGANRWGQSGSRFPHCGLLLPRGADGSDMNHTFSPAAEVRRAAQRGQISLVRPTKNAAESLERIGFSDLREQKAASSAISKRGAFVPLDALGATAIFFESDREEVDVKSDLDDQYEFVHDFEMSIPKRVAVQDAPCNRSRLAASQILQSSTANIWPDESGVAAAHQSGIRGGGTLIAVLDTGIDADHAEFANRRVNFRHVSMFPNSPSWPPRDVRGFDTDGHGTHVCGVLSGKTIGVAPDAGLYVASVIESETMATSMTRVAAGLNWVFRQFTRPDNEHLPGVLSMSLGFPPNSPSDPNHRQRLSTIQRFLSTLIQANVLPIIAIGNDGAGQYGYPGAYDAVLGVGAVDFDENIAGFSGSGKAPGQNNSKPDLVGYGVGVNSSIERDYDGQSVYQRLSGTSMATPYVSGIAALYRSLNPSLTVTEVSDILLDRAKTLSPKNRVGAGLARFKLK